MLDREMFRRDSLLPKILEDLPVGIMVQGDDSGSILWSNQFFFKHGLSAEEISKTVSKYIRNSAGSGDFENVGNKISVKSRGRRLSLGFSFYPIDESAYFVLFSEISYKTIFTNSKNENVFFDKLSELIAEIAHEIGNPLAGINLSLQVLLKNIDKWPAEKTREYISRAILEINRLSDFLKSIREVSKEPELKMRWLNLHEIIDKLFKQNSDLIKNKQIVTANNVPEDIKVYLDEYGFYQIILNLLNNSLQILKAGQKVTFSIDEVDRLYIKLVYANNGEPIASAIMDKIFSPFFTTKKKGDGMGLAISQKLMTRMGGTIKVETPENGIGVRFIIYIRNNGGKVNG